MARLHVYDLLNSHRWKTHLKSMNLITIMAAVPRCRQVPTRSLDGRAKALSDPGLQPRLPFSPARLLQFSSWFAQNRKSNWWLGKQEMSWFSLPNEGTVTGFDQLTRNLERRSGQKQPTHFTSYRRFHFCLICFKRKTHSDVFVSSYVSSTIRIRFI